jgi:flagellar hook-associated protein 3 FlgL
MTLSNILEAQKRLQEGQIQVATGAKSLSYSGIAKDSGRLVSLQGLESRFAQFSKNNSVIEGRLNRMEQSVSTIFDAMSEVRALLIQRVNATAGDDVPLAAVAGNLLDVVAGQLNVKENGRFLFAGTRTTTPPVPVPVPDPALFGTPEANYYQGDSIVLSARIDDSITIDYGITADRAPFQDAIAALKAAIQGDVTADSTLLDRALQLSEQAVESIAGVRAEIGSDLDTITRANQRNGDFLVFVEGTISDIVNVDVPTVVTQLASDQVILEASFITLARVGSLSLANYLG